MDKKCPFCGAELEKGYVQALHRMAWVKSPHKLSLLPKEGEILLGNHMFKDVILDACICKNCQKIIVDYSKK